MWRVAGLRVRSPSPPRATRSYASRLVLFFRLWSGAAFHLAGFAIFDLRRAKSIPPRSKWPALAGQSIDLFVSPRGSMTIQRQLVEPASLVPHTRLARTQRRCGSVRERKRPRAPSSADNAARGSTRPIDGRTFLRRVVSRASVRSSAFTQPSPARRPRRCAAAQQTSRAATGGCGVIRCSACPQPRCRRHRRTTRCASRRRSRTPRAQGTPEEQEGHVR